MIKVVIGGKTFYKVVNTSIDTSRPPNPTKHQVKTRNRIKRPATRGLGSQWSAQRPYDTSHYNPAPSSPLVHTKLGSTAPHTTYKHYDADTLGLRRAASHIER